MAAAADTTVVVVNPGLGRRASRPTRPGCSRSADLFVINKADRPGARETRRDLEPDARPDRPSATGARRSSRRSAATGDGVDELWAAIGRPPAHLLERRRLLEAPPGDAAEPRVPPGAARPGCAAEVDELAAGTGFAEATPAWSRALDPYEAADRLLGRSTPGRRSARAGTGSRVRCRTVADRRRS